MTNRLPTPGGDTDDWGSILNDYLSVSLNSDGTLSTAAIQQAGGELATNKGQANGYASLGNSTLVPTTELGTGSASTSTFLRGDGTWATPAGGSSSLSSDSDVSFTSLSNGQVLTYDSLTTMWENMDPAVVTVFGRSGAVTAQDGDYTAAQVGALPSTDDLSAIASANATAADVSLNNFKLTNVANGASSSDAATFGQIPTSLPPSGSAGGDLAGTYPDPTVKSRTVTVTVGTSGSSADYVCTGTNDDATINTAINAAQTAGGGTVLIRAGSYNLGAAITLVSSVHVIGEGLATVLTLVNNANSPAVLSATGGLSDVILSNMVIDGNGANQTSAGIGQSALISINGGATLLNNVLLENLWIKNSYQHTIFIHNVPSPYTGKRTIRNCSIYNHGTGTIGFGIYADYAPYTLIQGNYIEQSNGNDAIELGHVGGLICTQNYIVDGPIQFPFSNNSVISNNVVKANTIQNDANTANNVTITGNQVLNATPGTGYAGISVVGAAPIISNNYVKTTQNNGIRAYNASGATITGNNVNGPWTSLNLVNGDGIISDASSANVTIGNNVVTGFNRGIAIVNDNVTVNANQLLSCSAGIGLSNTSISGHVIAGAQLTGNSFSGNVTNFDPQNQNGYSFIASTSSTTSSSLTIGGDDYLATELYVEQPNASSAKDTLSLSNAGTGYLLRGYSGSNPSANLTSIGKLSLGINGLAQIDGSQGSGSFSTTLAVANLLSVSHTGTTGNAASFSRSGNSSSVVNGLTVSASNSGSGGAVAGSFTGGIVTDTLKVSTSPTTGYVLTSDNLGNATWQPATVTGLSIVSGKTLTVNNTLALAGTDSTTMTFPSTSDTVVTLTATQTLTNKRNTKRTVALTDGTTITPNGDTTDIATVTIAASRTMAAPTGTPTHGQQLLFQITQGGSGSCTITWNAIYEFSVDVPSPTLSTVVGKTDNILFVYSTATSTWQCLAVARGY